MPYKERSAARGMEEKFNRRTEKESKEALWQKGATRSKATRVRVVHRKSNSDICAV